MQLCPLVFPSVYPAALDPKFAGDGLDPGYLTTLPGTRDELFYEPAQFDPAVVEFDEKTKSTSTSTATEFANFPQIFNRPLDVRVPTLLVAGELDSMFCKENFDAVPAVRPACASACATFAVFVRSFRRDQRSRASGSRGR